MARGFRSAKSSFAAPMRLLQATRHERKCTKLFARARVN